MQNITNRKKIWVIADDRAGNVSQALGVAENLGTPFEIKNITYNKLATFPNFVRGASTLGISRKSREILKAPWPDIVIAAGRRTAPLARWIRNKSKNKSKLIQIMYPGDVGAKDFSLIAVPEHDIRAPEAKNILRVIGAPHRITDEKINGEKEKWEKEFIHLKKPFTALIIGGATKSKDFNSQMAKELAQKALELSGEEGSFLVTTSRRTGKGAESAVSKVLPGERTYFYKWGDKRENPYIGYLALADRIIVTGDSVSMCSECCSRNAPVYIYAPEEMISKKHMRLVNSLIDNGFASKLTGEIDDEYEKKGHESLNCTFDIANYIKDKFL
jgi:mitochondrial fission protein ELM1